MFTSCCRFVTQLLQYARSSKPVRAGTLLGRVFLQRSCYPKCVPWGRIFYFRSFSPAGRISTRSPVDAETAQQYEFPVGVRDSSGQTDWATVAVSVLNQNDNAPQFIADQLFLSAASNAELGAQVLKVCMVVPLAELSTFQGLFSL